jgi:hypothetical protein
MEGGGAREDNRFVVLVNYIVLLLALPRASAKTAFFFDFAGFENLCGILELIS